MDNKTHQEILAQTYGCPRSNLINQYARMTPRIRDSAIMTLSIPKKVSVEKSVPA